MSYLTDYPFAIFSVLMLITGLSGNKYALNVCIGFDCLVCALIGGWPGETLSSYAYRMDLQHKLGGRIFRPLIDWMFAWQRTPYGHCHDAWLYMKQRLNMPVEFR